MEFFELPFGVRVAGGEPLDGDRYVVASTAGRDSLLTNNRTHQGILIYVEDIKKLYILQGPTNTDWVEIALGGADLTLLFDQPIPAITWNINHDMGKHPAVSVLNSSGDEVEAEINYVDVDNIIITFNAAFAGKATLN
jgi:hypothetical protein